jgi:hypothetical protein
MQIRYKLEKILKELNVNRAYDVSIKLCEGSNHIFYYSLYNRNNKFQKGAGKHTILKYKNEEYKFYVFNEGNSISYNLYKNNDVNDIPECLIIDVNKKEKFVHIGGISYDDNCFEVNSIQKSGSTLLKIALKLIEKIEGYYGLKYIQLKDNSSKYCKKAGINIELSSLYMLTRADTWYGKYGFLPFDDIKQTVHKKNYDKYIQNKKIVNNILVKNTKIRKYLEKASNKLNLNISVKTFNILFEKYDNKTIVEFFYDFMKNFNKNCELFSLIYDQVMTDHKIKSLHNITYFKML